MRSISPVFTADTVPRACARRARQFVLSDHAGIPFGQRNEAAANEAAHGESLNLRVGFSCAAPVRFSPTPEVPIRSLPSALGFFVTASVRGATFTGVEDAARSRTPKPGYREPSSKSAGIYLPCLQRKCTRRICEWPYCSSYISTL